MSIKYKISFDYDLRDVEIEQGDGESEIILIDDSNFSNFCLNMENIKEFEKWFNEVETEESNKISILNVIKNNETEYTLILNSNYLDDKELGIAFLDYMFDNNPIEIEVNFTGSTYEDAWDDYKDSHYSKNKYYNYTKTFNINSFENVNVKIIK